MAAATLSNEVWKTWERQGKSDFLKHVKLLINHADENSTPLFEDSSTNLALNKAVHELIKGGLQGTVRREAVVTMISELVELHEDMAALITDIFGIIDVETSCTEGQAEERQRFCFILKDSEKFLSEKLLKERLEIETLQEVGTLKNRNFYTKFIKVKTKLYYKQRKFNLLREESEGYAKLITELGQDLGAHITPQFILEVIKSLIGCFNLDPNRVLDIILESFECRPEHDDFFIPLIRSYMGDPKILSEVLGFKFSLYHPSTAANTEGSATQTAITPDSLYILAALMLKHGIIRLDDIYAWLVPEDSSIQGDWEKEMRDAKEYVRKLNIISTKEKEDQPEETEPPADKYDENQKFGLGEALLRVGAWTQFQQLNRKLPENCLLTQAPVAKALCDLLHILMEPVYRANLGVLQGVIDKPKNPPKPPRLGPSQATTLLGLRDSVIPMLLALGPSLHLDPILMYKVIRISKAALGQICGSSPVPINPPASDSLFFDILTVLDEVLLPSLSHLESNCSVSEEMWSLLKYYPYQFRYCLYIRWKNESHQKHASLTKKRGDALKNIKSLMKRVSKENVKPVGRLIGKLTHSSPGFLFDYVLMQIQIYDNLIGPVVDSLKYLTSLSYDVLGCCLVESLSQADKKRFKHDGTSISLWLQSLASFCGAVFKKYPIELGGLLQYVANQLKAQKSLDLLILKEIVHKMAGVEAAEELTAEQLDAMSGGELLRAEAGYFSQARNTKKSSNRLKEALTEQNLAVALCLLMAQQRYCVEYRETENSHLKLVGKLYDQCQDTLVQFGTFLASSLSVEEYIGRLPTVNNMLAKFHIHADVAFFLARPMFTHAINNKCEALRRADPNGKNLTIEQRHEKYIEACNIILGPIVESVRPLHAPKIWEDISPQFLVTFWSLTTYDLYVPAKSYQNEVSKLKQMAAQAMENKEGATGKGKKEQEKLTLLMEKLQDERKRQTEHVEKVMARLKKEKDSWFLSRSAKSAKNETITQFLQLCLFPRCIFTAPDAVYCAKFVQTIHSLKTANFSTLLCYDRLFCDITYTVTSCTENEANRYGRFLCAMLDTVMRWHRTKETFDEECANFPGFVTKFKVSNHFSDANDHVGYENYRHVCHKWHYKITKALVVCLDSKDYVQIRNSLIILIKILPHFPVLLKLLNIVERKVEKVREEEKDKRQDLYILATSYCGQLKAKSSKMILEKDFHQVSDKLEHQRMYLQPGAVRPVEIQMIKIQVVKAQDTQHSSNQYTSGTTELNGEVTKGMDPPVVERKNVEAPSKTSSVSKRESTGTSKDRPREPEKAQRRDESERSNSSSRGKERREERVYREEQSPPVAEKWDRREDRHEESRYYDQGRSSQYRSSSVQDQDADHSSNSSPRSQHRLSQEPPDSDRDPKRRKLEGSSKRVEDAGKVEDKKERTSKSKPRSTDEEREMRKERKLGRKRDRADDNQQPTASTSATTADQKRRKDEEKAAKSTGHQNGDPMDHNRDKHRYSREKSPYMRERERERSHDRDKHRRSNDGKRR